jgi:precorrin-6B methylase 2
MGHTLKNRKTNISLWMQLATILKDGPIKQNRQDFFGEDWLNSIAEAAECGAVAETINAITGLGKNTNLQTCRRLLDLGGGHGLYAVAFTALNPQLEAFVFDLPHMIPIAQKYVAAYNAQRVHLLSGDFYKDDIGKDYDVIFSSFNPSCNDPKLIPKLVTALKPGGSLILRRFKEPEREDALKTLDWNLFTFEGKKVGSQPHTSGPVMDRKTYLAQLESAGLQVLQIVHANNFSEILLACKPSGTGSAP